MLPRVGLVKLAMHLCRGKSYKVFFVLFLSKLKYVPQIQWLFNQNTADEATGN
jgi:hypothetical protein